MLGLSQPSLVDVRWRPSGGRGEYEHTPSAVLMDRRVLLNCLSVPGAVVVTDVFGRLRDGKPRLRREDPNDRDVLNLHQLVAAIALLPQPVREDRGPIRLPLEEKQYVISRIVFDADTRGADGVVCTPRYLRLLHDDTDIDLRDRLIRVRTVLDKPGLPAKVAHFARLYSAMLRAGTATSEIVDVSRSLRLAIAEDRLLARVLDAPSGSYMQTRQDLTTPKREVNDLTADETKRRLSLHYRIDRNRAIRQAKVDLVARSRGELVCENCSFDFGKKYGQRGVGFIEVHHRTPLAILLPNTITCLDDLVLLCANCHRVVHRFAPLISPGELAATTSSWWPKSNGH